MIYSVCPQWVKRDINVPSQPIHDLVLRHIPESKVLSDVSAEFALQLPLESAPKFQGLLNELDENLQTLGVSTYGISVTTLEEVFLNVAKIAAPEKHYQNKKDASLDVKDKNDDSFDLDDYNIERDRMKGSFSLFWTHFWALVKKRLNYIKRDQRGMICELILPVLMVVGGILIANAAISKEIPSLTITDDMYDYKFQMDYNAIVPADGAAINPNFIKNLPGDYINLQAVDENTAAEFDARVVDDQGPILTSPINVFSIMVTQFDTTLNQYFYTTFLDTRAQEGSVYAMNKVNNAILRTATGNSKKTITVINTPFHKTAGSKSIDKIASGIIYAFVMGIAMSLLPASLITYIVKERECNAKHQQIVSGVSTLAYWTSNFFVDIIKYMIPAVINVVAAIVLEASALTDGDKLKALWLEFILYGFAIIPFVYLTAFLFRNFGTAQIAAFFFNFATGFIMGLIVALLRAFELTRHSGEILQWALRPFPSFAMTYGLLNLAK